ncbi:hypothetical protein ABVT39_017016 [Epinephelus coioides]
MTSLDPLKTVISIGNVDDTSLALPSGNQYGSGQQRVLEQVQSIRRTKSRQSSSSRTGSTSLSPTSPRTYSVAPSYDSVFIEAPKSQSSISNGGAFFGNSFARTLHFEKNNRQLVNNYVGSTVKRNTGASTYQYERGYAPLGSKAVGPNNTSRSEPDMAWQRSMPKRSAPQQGFLANRNTYRVERTKSQLITSTAPQPPPQLQRNHTVNGTGQARTKSQFVCSQAEVTKTLSKPPAVTESAPKSKGDFGSNDNSGFADITMKEAVDYLSREDETYQHCGASYIQHNTFIDDKAKEEVLKFNGIQPLVGLLRSPSQQVSQTASAALRNLSFKSNSNKEEIHRCDGVMDAVSLLRDTDSVEIQKQLTGLLWNLSSADSLKPDLLKSALPVLMERVILPYTTGPDRTSKISQDPEVFFNATGLLRNLSSTKQSNRQAMRKCRGLVDSLVSYVKDCVDAGKPDDKVSGVMSQNIVQKLNGLQVITPLLKSDKVNLQRNVVALVGNLTRNPNLHNAIARKALPELLDILAAGTKGGNESDDTLAMACQTSNCLLMKEQAMGKLLIKYDLIKSLKELSQNGYFPKSSKAAALLLYNLWSDKEIQTFLKKKGMSKASFVNDVTTAAHKSAHIVD